MKDNNRLTVLEQLTGGIPDYYDTMYLDGYKPYQILQSAHKTIMKKHYEKIAQRQADREAEEPMNVNLSVEVKRNDR